MREVVAHDVGRLAGDNGRMDLGVKRFTPGEGRLGHLDFLLALIELLDDLFHPDTITAAEEVPVGDFNWIGVRQRQGSEACCQV